ncbi:serine hydrolase domain-containing protein [Micromonospora sp. HK10]|uniref:serine hydrolase domain-containing protein n=1 Tax=Micromonospora sp. HK10 TaxID=1538294 RepID=UPI00062701D5|nr:serine hydrolase domain-containing protein [Micromonospora sp. HK10]
MDAQAGARELVDRLVETGQETGVQVAAYLRGELVVDAWAGLADPAGGRRVDPHTLFHSWSTAKGWLSTTVHVLAEQGLLDYDTPVAEYWPRFAVRGKGRITLRHVLTHTAGIPQAPVGITAADLADWDGMCARIADLAPLWEPGSTSAYHALTFGYLLGEVVRRATGRSAADVLREEVARPLGIADDLFFGVPAVQHHRLARLEDGNWATAMARRPPGSLFAAAAPAAVQPRAELGNHIDYLVADVPTAGTMTARAAARMYAALIGDVDGVRLISPRRAAHLATVATAQTDPVLGVPVPKGLGYFLGLPEMGGHARAFGAKGSGGSIAFADPEHGFAFAFAHNRMTAPPADLAGQVATRIRDALGITPPGHPGPVGGDRPPSG